MKNCTNPFNLPLRFGVASGFYRNDLFRIWIRVVLQGLDLAGSEKSKKFLIQQDLSSSKSSGYNRIREEQKVLDPTTNEKSKKF